MNLQSAKSEVPYLRTVSSGKGRGGLVSRGNPWKPEGIDDKRRTGIREVEVWGEVLEKKETYSVE